MTQNTAPDKDYPAMEARMEQLRAQVLDTAKKIVEVVKRDIEKFAERESRWRFLRHVAFAEAMSDEDIRALKKRLRAFGVETGDKVSAQLANEELWLDPNARVPKGGNPKTLEHNPSVWGVLQTIASETGAVFESFGFPADPSEDPDSAPAIRYHLVYRTPVYFLDGVYCPSLIESYWSQLGELNQLGDELATSRLDSRRKKLEERWNRV